MESFHMIRSSPALQWVTLGSIVAYLGYNTGGMFVTGECTLLVLKQHASKLQRILGSCISTGVPSCVTLAPTHSA